LKTLSSTSTLRDIIPALVLFLQDTATTETPTLSLHDALPIFAAYGRHAQVSLWRSLVYPPTPGVQRVDPAALTPWDSAFQPASDPGVLRRRPATALDLPLDGPTFALLLLDTGSFVATPQPRPVLVRPLVTFLAGGEAFVGTTDAVAFGWTTRYAAGW